MAAGSRYGAGPQLVRTGPLAQWLGPTVAVLGRHVFLVTDPGLLEAGHVEAAVRALTEAGLSSSVYCETCPDPSESDAEHAAAALEGHKADVVVALGGGSAIDLAKAALMLVAQGGRMRDHVGPGGTAELLPLIAVPTTAGTGSEAQSFALITHDDDHHKLACGHPGARPRVVLLDPALTTSMPRQVTALSGADALVHALETAVTTVGTDASRALAAEAFTLLWPSFPRVLDDPEDLEARAAMLRGAYLAGAAIEGSMLGAAHALANPLTARFHLAHGAAVGLMAPAVVRHNLGEEASEARYGALAASVGLQSAAQLPDALRAMLAHAGLPTTLPEHALAVIDELAADAAAQWTGTFNPVPLDAAGFTALYRATAR